MNSLESTLSAAGNGGAVKQLASQFGINPDQASSTVTALLPTLAKRLGERLASSGGAALSDLISSGRLSNFAEDPASLAGPAALTQGTSLLNQILGGGDVTDITSPVAQKVGINSSIVTKILPIATVLLGGILTKGMTSGQGNLREIVGALASGGQDSLKDNIKPLP